MKQLSILLSIYLSIFIFSCNTPIEENKTLPFIPKLNKETGEAEVLAIRPFSFINQDSIIINNKTFEGKIYVADFFLINCTTICPKVKTNMLHLYEEFKDNEQVYFLSHSIDIKRDSVPALKDYADKLGVDSKKWHFVTGDKTEIYDITEDYNSSAVEGDQYPDGFDHSGYLILIDGKGFTRAFARGTDRESTNKLIEDINTLLAESSQE